MSRAANTALVWLLWISACGEDWQAGGSGGYGGYAGYGGVGALGGSGGTSANGGAGGAAGLGGLGGSAGVGGTGGAVDAGMDAALHDDASIDANLADTASDTEADAGVDDALYSVTDPLAVSITVAAADWDVLRREGRNMPVVIAGCEDTGFDGYTEVDAVVRVGDETLAGASIRKKGFLGSISVYRPSLRIDVGSGAMSHFHGQKHLTLNNNRQDPSNSHQCVTYGLFAQAGLKAPRCGLAHVSVNGADKGYYTMVEPIEAAFLRRVFGNDEGNLYESTVPADFTANAVDRFELKNNETVNDRSDLQRVITALQASDDQLLSALDAVIDLDEWISFWAMEVLTSDWDGLNGDLNNTFLYHDPSDDRFHPIVWGTDQTLVTSEERGLRSVYTVSAIAKRLYAHPMGRARYHARLRELLRDVWDEDAIVADVRAITTLTDAPAFGLEVTEANVRSQRQAIETELQENGGRGPEPETVALIGNCRPTVAASSAIDFTWDASPTAYKPTFGVEMSVPTRRGNIALLPLAAFQLAVQRADGMVQMGIAGVDTTSGRSLFVGLIMPPESYRTGEVEFHGFETFGIVAIDASETEPRALGTFIGGEGGITFTQIGTTTGAVVRGSWQAQAALNENAP